MRIQKFIGILSVVICFVACHADRRMEQVLELSGDNRAELQKVLDHYKGDSLKYEAACFLIENMPGAFGADPAVVSTCAPFYEQYDSLLQVHGYDSLLRAGSYSRFREWGDAVDSLWQNFEGRHAVVRYGTRRMDLLTVSADHLIAEIDLAFEAWRENVYTRDCSFDDFCEYILPYRRKNGLVIDSMRRVFHDRHKGQFFTHSGNDMIDEMDSLLYRYRHITHSNFYGTRIPVLTAGSYEKLRHGLCEQRCWYNSLLLSSLGMTVAIDYVPVWGNRNSSHTWNVLVMNGKSYAFESYWDTDRWKYKRIYNNRDNDEYWGRFRLPKVYRHTFRRYPEGPLADRDVPGEDIPEFFRNVRRKDVSHEYFDTVNVSVRLDPVPEGTRYAYLCVVDYGEWKPVQWGRIEKGKVVFPGMGKGVVYMPMYCKGGIMQVAGNPFWLKPDGSMRPLMPDGKKQSIAVCRPDGASVYAYQDNWKKDYADVAGTMLEGWRENDSFRRRICVFPTDLENGSKWVAVNGGREVRYVRMKLPYGRVALGRLEFYRDTEDGGTAKVQGVRVMGALPENREGEKPDYLLDGVSATGYKNEISCGYIDFDLGRDCLLAAVRFCPYLETDYRADREYELCFWQDGWRVLGRHKGPGVLRMDSVPCNALLLVRHPRGMEIKGRPFIYEDGEVIWL